MHGLKESIIRLVYTALFLGLFLLLNNSPLADSIQIRVVYSRAIVPVYQWILILAFMAFWKYLSNEPWKTVSTKVAILGLILCLYLPMLDTQLGLWRDCPLSRIYNIYIALFIFFITTLFIFGGAFSLTRRFERGKMPTNILLSDPIFSLLFLLSIYGTYFYYIYGHVKEAVLLCLLLVFSPLILFKARSATKLSGVIKAIFKYISEYKRLTALIFISALILRLIFFFNLLSIEGARYPFASDDGPTYDLWGREGVKDPMIYFKKSPHYFWVFYATLLTLIYRIFGHSYVAVGLVQSLIGAILCSLIFMFAYRITRLKTVALLASFGACIDSTLIFLTTTLNTEVLYIPFIFIVLLLLLYYRETKNALSAILFLVSSALFLGVATIIRTTGIGLVAFILPWLLLWGRPYLNKRFANRLRDTCIFFILVMLTVSPITIANYVNTGKFYLVYDTTGAVEWKARVHEEDIMPSNKKFIEMGIKDPLNEPLESIKAIFKAPKDFIKAFFEIVPKRILNLFFLPNFGYFDPIFLMNPARAPNRFASHLLFYTLLLFISSFIIFVFSNIKPSFKTLTLLVIAYYALLHGVVFLATGPRYGAPMRPFINIVIAFGLYKLVKTSAAACLYKR